MNEKKNCNTLTAILNIIFFRGERFWFVIPLNTVWGLNQLNSMVSRRLLLPKKNLINLRYSDQYNKLTARKKI